MTPFTPENFMHSVIANLNAIRELAPAEAKAAVNLAGNFFELVSEINTNLNRIAAAQETVARLMLEDMTDAIDAAAAEKAEADVNQYKKEQSKRSFIGQKDG